MCTYSGDMFWTPGRTEKWPFGQAIWGVNWPGNVQISRESNSPIGWVIERQFLRILRFSELPSVFRFHLQHPCLVDDLSWLKLELSNCEV